VIWANFELIEFNNFSMSQRRRSKNNWDRRKVVGQTASAKLQEACEMLEAVKQKQQASITLQPSCVCFDMQSGDSAKLQLVELLWGCNFAPLLGELQQANPDITTLLLEAVSNSYSPDNEELFWHKQGLKLESLLATMYRCQNQFKMPLWTVLRSIYSVQHGMHLESWNIESAVRLLASHKWTKSLVALGTKHNPGAPFDAMGFVTAAVFDNFTVKIDYKSLHDLEHHGYRLDMTNWGSVTVPAAVAPGLNVPLLLASECG
jgi:hypothetical protein